MKGAFILVYEHESKVKCAHRFYEFHFSAEGNPFGDETHQGWLNADGLRRAKL